MKVLIILTIFVLFDGSLASLWSSSNNYTLLCSSEDVQVCRCPQDDSDHSVDCTDKELRQIPTDITFPDHVKNVIFKENKIESLTTTYFTSGRGVLLLDFSFNKIHFVATGAFFNFENLEILDLSHNELWTLPFKAFDGLKLLTTLDLSYNRITTFFPEVFQPCVAVRELSMRFNPVLFVEKDSFQYLTAIEKLNLESTGLATLPYAIFKNNTLLYSLILSGNALNYVPSQGLMSATGLTELDISENPISVLTDDSFKGLTKLEVLTASHMRRLRKIEAGAFRETPNLVELLMSDNLQLNSISRLAFVEFKLSTGDAEFIERSRPIEKVVLRHCGLTSLPKNLLRWDELKELDLSENPWDCDCNMGWISDSTIRSESKKSMVCTNPPHLGGKNVAGLDISDFTCRLLSIEAIIGLSLLVSLSFVLALGGAAFLLFKKRICRCIRRRKDHKYMRIITKKEKIDLEWDHEPFVKSSDA